MVRRMRLWPVFLSAVLLAAAGAPPAAGPATFLPAKVHGLGVPRYSVPSKSLLRTVRALPLFSGRDVAPEATYPLAHALDLKVRGQMDLREGEDAAQAFERLVGEDPERARALMESAVDEAGKELDAGAASALRRLSEKKDFSEEDLRASADDAAYLRAVYGPYLAEGRAELLGELDRALEAAVRDRKHGHLAAHFQELVRRLGAGEPDLAAPAAGAESAPPKASNAGLPPEAVSPRQERRQDVFPRAPPPLAGEASRQPQFITLASAQDLIRKSLEDLQGIAETRAKNGQSPLSEAQRREILLKRIYRRTTPPTAPGRSRGRGGLIVSDTSVGIHLSKLMAEGIILDHHGEFYDPLHPEVNSTMLAIRLFRLVLAGPETSRDKVRALRSLFRNVTTDNAGDGAHTVWLARNVERVVSEPELLDVFEILTWIEDFGLFGSLYLEMAAQGRFQHEKYGDLLELERSILQVYDEALASFGVEGSDRFAHLPAEKQAALMEEILKGISLSLDDMNFRRARAAVFLKHVEAVKKQLPDAVVRLSAEDAAELKREGVDPGVLDEIFVFDQGKLTAGGVFSRWAAPPLFHGKNVQLGFTGLSPGRLQVIFAAPNGRRAATLEPIGGRLRRTNEKMGRDRGFSKEAVLKGEAGMIGGRSELQVAFRPGLVLSPGEVQKEIARELAASGPLSR